MSDAQGAKAIGLVESGGIAELSGGGVRLFEARSSSGVGTYIVVLRAGDPQCTCPASGECYHIRAARLLARAERGAAGARFTVSSTGGRVLAEMVAYDEVARLVRRTGGRPELALALSEGEQVGPARETGDLRVVRCA